MEKGNKEFRHIVRVVNTDLDGNKKIGQALTKIKGVSFMYANAICKLAGIDRNQKTGDMGDEQVDKLDEVIKNPIKFKVPIWMMNRRNEPETGADTHLVSSDVVFVQDNDVKSLKKMKCYRGFRHIDGLPCRGQRTKSNFRRNKSKLTGRKRKK